MRKLGLTVHVVFSVGWLGAVTCFLVLAVAGLTGDARTAAATATAMAFATWFAILPLGIGSFLSGLLQGFGTSWGLFQHYWVLLKLLSTFIALVVLALHLGPISALDASADLAPDVATELRARLAGAAAAAIALLVFMTALSVYKPKGRTTLRR